MKQTGCEHESEVIRALTNSAWSEELRRHAAACAECGQALRVAEALQAEVRCAESECTLPDAHWVLERARRRAREMAVARMSRMLMAARIVAVGYAAAVVCWVARGYAESQVREVASAMHGGASGFALLGAAAAAVCVAAGLWPILRTGSERR